MKQGQTDKALSSHKEALEVQVELGDAKELHAPTTTWAICTEERTIVPKPWKHIPKKRLSAVMSHFSAHKSFLDVRCWILEKLNARKHAFEVFERTDKADDLLAHARAQALLGRYHAKMNDAETSMHHYTESLNIMSDVGDPISWSN